MANVTTIVGGQDAFATALYGLPSGNDSLFRESYARAKELIVDTSSRFLEESRAIYDRYNGTEVVQKAKRLLRGLGNIGVKDLDIYYLTEREMHTAKTTMRRYILAHPKLNRDYQRQTCDAWGDDGYKQLNKYHGDPKLNPDYLMVMDGIDLPETKEVIFYSGEEELDINDQMTILDTWNNVDLMLARYLDPTADNNL